MKKIAIIGASGMTGSEAVKSLLERSDVESIVSFVRKSGSTTHPKLNEVVLTDLADKASYLPHLKNTDAALCCVGVYTGKVDDKTFAHVTTDIPVAFAQAIEEESPGIPYCFLSRMGADPTEKSRMIFARTKGAAEAQIGAMTLEFRSIHAFDIGESI